VRVRSGGSLEKVVATKNPVRLGLTGVFGETLVLLGIWLVGGGLSN
jgi:hypothetical protein